MCNCIKELQDDLRPKIHEQFSTSDKNRGVRYFVIRATSSGRAIINISIDVRRTVRPLQSFIVADYCPWCGVKYEGV